MLRSVHSLTHDGARSAPDVVNQSYESPVGSAHGSPSGATTGIIAGGSPREGGARAASNLSRGGGGRSAGRSRRAFACPLISGTWQVTHFTRRSIAPTTIT